MCDAEKSIDEMEHSEPGASHESMLITTDSIEEFSQEMSASISDLKLKSESNGQLDEVNENTDIDIQRNGTLSTSESFSNDDNTKSNQTLIAQIDDDESVSNYFQNPDWLEKVEHVFILSTAGKPIYALHGNEDKLATLFGVMQALVSVVQTNQDTLTSIHATGIKFVFLVKSPLILVAASRKRISVQQIQLKLTDVYNQILSTLTLSHMTKIFEKRKNFDLRRLLAGSERLIDHLLLKDSVKFRSRKVSNNPFIFLTHSVRILPLSSSNRENITKAIQSNCSKIKNLVFALLIANNKLITLVRMKKYFIHPADLRIIFNLIECSESFKTAESWTPICLPKFDANGFLHAHVSYLTDDCQACLMLLSVDRDVFFPLSDAKKKITEKLQSSQCLKAINEASDKTINLQLIGIPEIRHFLYKSKSNAQLLCSEITAPYNTLDGFRKLENIYFDIHHRIHNTSRPLKLIYEMSETETTLAWLTTGYELYAIFEPTIDRNTVTTLVNTLLAWIKKEEDRLFILSAPTF